MKSHCLKIHALALYLSCWCGLAQASTSGSMSLLEFKAGGVVGVQPGGGQSVGPQLAWAPLLPVAGWLGLRPTVALSIFNSRSDETKFLAPEAALLGSLDFGLVSLDAGPGMQIWIGQGVTSLSLSADVSLHTGHWFGLIDRIVVGYSYLLAKTAKVSEIKLGFGFNL